MGEILAVELFQISKSLSNTMVVIHWWNFSYSKSFNYVVSLSREKYRKWESITKLGSSILSLQMRLPVCVIIVLMFALAKEMCPGRLMQVRLKLHVCLSKSNVSRSLVYVAY